jgi:hypothetical protein
LAPFEVRFEALPGAQAEVDFAQFQVVMILKRRRSSTKRCSSKFVVRMARRCVTGNRRWAMQASKSSMKPWKHATALSYFAPIEANDAGCDARWPGRRLIGRLRADLEVRPDILRHLGRQIAHAMRQATLPGRARKANLDGAGAGAGAVDRERHPAVSRSIVPPWPIGSAAYLRFPRCCVFRKRTPGPPPFSDMN